MKATFKYFLFSILLLYNLSNLYSQEGFSMVGGDVVSSKGSSSYTVGQTVYIVNESSSYSISQGVQQPIVLLIVEEATEIKLNCEVYPNPTNNEANISHTIPNNEVLSYKLYDIKGSFVKSGRLENSNTKIDIQSLKSGTYLLNLISEGKPTKTCKIIKGN